MNQISKVKLNILPGSAVPGKVGQKLAPRGVALPKFCTEFNERTASEKGADLEKRVIVLVDTKAKSFEIQIKSAPVSRFILKKIGKAGSGKARRDSIATLKQSDLNDIVKIKHKEAQEARRNISEESIRKSVEGTLASMGVKVSHES